MFKKISSIFVVISLLLVQGCNSDEKYAKQIAQEIDTKMVLLKKSYQQVELAAEKQISPKAVYKSTLNIALGKLKAENPNDEAINELVKQFKYDTTKEGEVFSKYKTEYNNVLENTAYQKIKNQNFTGDDLNSFKNLNNEVDRLNSSLNVKRFDENFVDYINIAASLSPNIDPVVITKSEISKDAAVGSQLVGNPQYGQWQQNSNGDMFWNFFAAYMFLDFLEDTRYNNYSYGYGSYGSHRYSGKYKHRSNSNYRYDNWNNKRNWSYYNDKYVKDYAKPTEKAKYNKWSNKGTSKYSSNFKENKTLAKSNKKLSTNTKFKSNFSSRKNTGTSSGSKFGGSKFKSSMKSPNVRSSKSSKSTRSGK